LCSPSQLDQTSLKSRIFAADINCAFQGHKKKAIKHEWVEIMTNLFKICVLEGDINLYHNLANTNPKYVRE
jgi:hypothetical protein